MTDQTSRFQLPLLAAGQAQKEVTHNEALLLLDALASPAVEGSASPSPPAAPVPGQAWIVGAGATGAWASHDDALAIWTEAGWRFLSPRDGMAVWRQDTGMWIIRNGGVWRDDVFPVPALSIAGKTVVGSQQPAIPDPAGGTEADGEGRAAIAAILQALRAHGLIAR